MDDMLVATLTVQNSHSIFRMSFEFAECTLQTQVMDQMSMLLTQFAESLESFGHKKGGKYASSGASELKKFKEEVIQSYLGAPKESFGNSPRETELEVEDLPGSVLLSEPPRPKSRLSDRRSSVPDILVDLSESERPAKNGPSRPAWPLPSGPPEPLMSPRSSMESVTSEISKAQSQASQVSSQEVTCTPSSNSGSSKIEGPSRTKGLTTRFWNYFRRKTPTGVKDNNKNKITAKESVSPTAFSSAGYVVCVVPAS